jgi:hypothetical protein
MGRSGDYRDVSVSRWPIFGPDRQHLAGLKYFAHDAATQRAFGMTARIPRRIAREEVMDPAFRARSNFSSPFDDEVTRDGTADRLGVLVRQHLASDLFKTLQYCIKILTFIPKHVLMHMLFAKREYRV